MAPGPGILQTRPRSQGLEEQSLVFLPHDLVLRTCCSDALGRQGKTFPVPAPSQGSPMGAPTPLRDLHWTPREGPGMYFNVLVHFLFPG